MLSNIEFIRQSLELNLFFMRIAKEHAIFLEAGLVPKDYALARQGDMLKNEFSKLLVEAIRLSNGVLSKEVASSGELVTNLTVASEEQTAFLSGIRIDSNITYMELELVKGAGSGGSYNNLLDAVTDLNRRAMIAANQIAIYKKNLLDNVLSCRLFTTNYPLLIDHVLREAQFYMRMLIKLQNREELNMQAEAIYQEAFWNRIMAEHSKFIRGLLDPTEVKLFDTANDYGKIFDELTAEAQGLVQNNQLFNDVTSKSLKQTTGVRDFKRQGTAGLVQCNIRSIAFSLLGDHVVREANHYLRLLKSYSR